MNLMQSFRMALATIRINKVRSFLTMLGIIIGVTAVIALVSVMQGYNADLTQYYEKMGVNKITVSASVYQFYDSLTLTAELEDYVQSDLGTVAAGVTPTLSTSGTLAYGANTVDTSTVSLGSAQFSVCNNFVLQDGRDIAYMDVVNKNHVCVIGSYVAETLFGSADPVGETITFKSIPFLVVGVYYEKDGSTASSMDDMIVMPYTLNAEVLGSVAVSTYTVKAADATVMDTLYNDLDAFLKSKLDDDTGTYTLKNENSELNESDEEAASLSLVLGAVASIALLVGGIGIMNIMLVTVTERTREIGIRKAIGANRRAIITQFLIESGVLSALGGVIGIILGFIITVIVGKAMYDMILVPNTLMAVGSFVFSIGIGVGFGLYPAIKASGLQPVVALRAD
ncbi:putative ABC transport system permease protein [Sporobacter termitidis DSM 10068]|uniref:Putative ABC transport system permease protein n=1 Tax=Sporobacter termitidis DSM 10068 TaxID=1123282 RepID=A0A1M5YT06_9FIRM|nr:ABC transporter permease [Sporobacter termitidis]SHI15192.1 putative ABC transport system permease protein [Sporobacter termitidis DSM 10068]